MGIYETVSMRLEELLPKIKDREIAIYPFGRIGRLCRFVLDEYYGIKPKYIVDNKCHDDEVMSSREFYAKVLEEGVERPYVLFSTADYRYIHQLLPELLINGFHIGDIGIIYKESILSYRAIDRVLASVSQGNTLLDIGCGPGIQGRIFEDNGVNVTGLTMDPTGDYSGNCLSNVVVSDLMSYMPNQKFDVVWCSHMLEHFYDIGEALRKIKNDLIKDGGILSITVPAREKTILMNHIHYFDAGRLIRYLMFAGFDCRNAEILEYGYNLSLILPSVNFIPDNMIFENEASHEPGDYHDGYGYDDMEEMFLQYMPTGIKVSRAWDNAPYFVGDIKELNWKGNQLSSF